MLTEQELADAVLWEEGVCLSCGHVSEPLEDLTAVTSCERCGACVLPAVLLLQVRDFFDFPF